MAEPLDAPRLWGFEFKESPDTPAPVIFDEETIQISPAPLAMVCLRLFNLG